MTSPFDSRRFWIGLFLFSVYLLSFSGQFHVMDELAVFTAGNNLAQHGRADINQLIWTNHWTPNPPGIWGQDGNLYTKKAPGISIITAPLIWLGHTLPGLNAVHVGLLTNALVTAVTASLLYVWLTDLGFARLSATFSALGYGLGTFAWIYARMFWESSLLAFSILVAVWAVYRATRLAYARQRLYWICLSGLAIAMGLTLRFEAVPAILLLSLYLVWESVSWRLAQLTGQVGDNPQPASQEVLTTYQPATIFQLLRTLPQAIPWGRLAIFFTPAILVALSLLYFNFVRYGSLSETGYTQELRFEAPWVGGYGLLFSPGRGLFIYAPLLLLLFLGIRPAHRRLSRPYFWLIATLCLFYWLFYGSWFAWGGTWGWGPRFLLPVLPLLMLFVAEPIEKMVSGIRPQGSGTLSQAARPRPTAKHLAWLGFVLLALLSLLVNLLGIVVDFNEHFLRLGRNDNFVFNWAAFPPVAHWRILQEGLIDLIWIRRQPNGLTVDWSILTPALILFGLAAAGLGLTIRDDLSAHQNNHRSHPWTSSQSRGNQAGRKTKDNPLLSSGVMLYALLFIALPFALTYQVMLGTARVAMETGQAQADVPLLETLTGAVQPNDALLVPMPPFGDVQEVSTRLLAYFDRPVPTAAWIESEPRAIQPAERAQMTRAALTKANRVWLFERWHTQTAPLGETRAWFNRHAFPVHERWFEQSGRLTLYAVGHSPDTGPAMPLEAPFQGGLRLRDYTLLDPTLSRETSVLRLRLTWQTAGIEDMVAQGLTADRLTAFVQLIGPTGNLAQSDRLLLDLQRPEQSPLLPDQTVPQGYGLALPDDLRSGSYPLIVGLYNAATGQRLLRADGSGDDFLYLTDVVVE